MCVWCASGTFRIDAQHGRSRVYAQWVDSEEKIEVSMSPCLPFITVYIYICTTLYIFCLQNVVALVQNAYIRCCACVYIPFAEPVSHSVRQ